MADTQTWSRREIWTRKLIYPGPYLSDRRRAGRSSRSGLPITTGSSPRCRRFLAFLAGWLIQFAGVVTDNYENLVRQPDDREHPELVDAVRSGLLTLAGLRDDDPRLLWIGGACRRWCWSRWPACR